jgi:hypothetical protein
MGQRDLNYPLLTKAGFLLGLTLFLGGAGGSMFVGEFLAPGPNWLATAFIDIEAIGLVIGFFSPFIFGIFLPLTE